ncbi:MAG: hydrogenase maturation protease [Calditrichaeota bacterium]|nr:hydrogenase maturation protease [Calditrichota bacterium]MCB9367326.1 hydrogenase maturation protease [Calditrichota bacterium]
MHRTLIIGIGNALRGDDGVAQRVIELISHQHMHADLECVTQLTIEHSQKLRNYETVLFIDASILLPPGEWTIESLAPHGMCSAQASHHCTPADVIELAALLFDASPDAYLLSIGASKFDERDSLGEPLQAALPNIVADVKSFDTRLSRKN